MNSSKESEQPDQSLPMTQDDGASRLIEFLGIPPSQLERWDKLWKAGLEHGYFTLAYFAYQFNKVSPHHDLCLNDGFLDTPITDRTFPQIQRWFDQIHNWKLAELMKQFPRGKKHLHLILGSPDRYDIVTLLLFITAFDCAMKNNNQTSLFEKKELKVLKLIQKERHNFCHGSAPKYQLGYDEAQWLIDLAQSKQQKLLGITMNDPKKKPTEECISVLKYLRRNKEI